jgi:hypothetical protein
MKAVSGTILATIITLILVIVILALLLGGFTALQPIIKGVVENIINGMKRLICDIIPIAGDIAKLFGRC